MNCETLRTSGTVAVVGAGPAGAALARLLQMRGFSVRVFERDASRDARPQGGSLDLRRDAGQRAVDAAGLTEVFKRFSRDEAKSFKMLDGQGVAFPGGGEETHEDPGPEIDRGDLRGLLLDSLEPDTVLWNRTVQNVTKEENGRWRLEFKEGEPFVADLVVGADGVGSKVRPHLTQIQPTYCGMAMLSSNIRRDLWRDSEISEIIGEGSAMFAHEGATVFVQRCNRDLILLYFSMKVERDWPKSQGFSLEDTEPVLAAVREAYHGWSPELIEMVTQIEGGFRSWPLSVMPPDYTWETQPGLAMVGDASHAMPPFTGKGVNLALLDSLELANALIADPAAEVAEAVNWCEVRMQGRTHRETGACLEVGRQIYGLEVEFATA